MSRHCFISAAVLIVLLPLMTRAEDEVFCCSCEFDGTTTTKKCKRVPREQCTIGVEVESCADCNKTIECVDFGFCLGPDTDPPTKGGPCGPLGVHSVNTEFRASGLMQSKLGSVPCTRVVGPVTSSSSGSSTSLFGYDAIVVYPAGAVLAPPCGGLLMDLAPWVQLQFDSQPVAIYTSVPHVYIRRPGETEPPPVSHDNPGDTQAHAAPPPRNEPALEVRAIPGVGDSAKGIVFGDTMISLPHCAEGTCQVQLSFEVFLMQGPASVDSP